ncbi:cytochrome c [Geomonas sp. RF6]|uniref:c-type cytochrome n=1 Tax=Geomonas sp. RF6 TaxID=2897342 RepID=UPI001E30B099|nr:cytochrome c [Geomonas sp. RF6]UFS70402.1 cytochrome c [Geomonas sp. RF6]
MKRILLALVLACAPLLTAAIWMDEQPSHKPNQAPLLAPPAGAVPVTGVESVPEGDVKNPVPTSQSSVNAGRALYSINCFMCHGDAAKRGAVGLKLNPPPPGLTPPLIQALNDTIIFGAITKGFGRMPPFQDKLSPEERWNIINYLRALR